MIRVWRNLQRLNQVEFRIEPGADGGDGWYGCGHGETTVIDDGDVLHIHEQGHFVSDAGRRPAVYRNAYRWQWRGHFLSLAHERFGADAAVHLVDLVAADDRMLIASEPHLCGQDQYKVRVWPVGHDVHAQWQIIGPRKNTKLYTAYKLVPPVRANRLT